MDTDEITSIEWTGLCLMVFGCVVAVAGIWIKMGAESAMIVGGLFLACLGSYVFRNSAA